MRYLTNTYAAGALRRGREIEQLISAFEDEGRRGLRWCSISPVKRFRGFVVRLYIVEECEWLPVDEFPAFYAADEDQDGARTVGETESSEAAIELAERELGADRGRWVNQGVLFDEYRDFIESGRPLGRWKPS
ncbi:hypothetical protein [Actinomadura montaniterrae]|uniref:Uncharacterized protein n=1 Tax=Actinomadura montaniterrae TaxID=1803903 RepID=A0A6L3VSQ8_9ACTN|nr:hypothetical protein [Actinomadura montaniterrae]KAB2380117.1 hypothetical protein F9B16_18225 [Actinomadura montaniterrae]